MMQKVLVDTSVWIDHVNGHGSDEAEALLRLIDSDVELCTCGVIAAEFLQGLRKDSSVRAFSALFQDLLWLTPREPDSYLAAAALYRKLRRRGITVRSTIDCLIAVLAVEGDAALLARDADMDRIVASGMLPGLAKR
jgi:predicted nucleic acid-binding protein